jgi:colicin import membrane protein
MGVQWKQQQQVAEVELWSERPQAEMHAAPPAPPVVEPEPPKVQPQPKPEVKPLPQVEPKPTPVKPDIAIEKKKPEPKRPEPPKPEPPKPQPPKPEPPKPEPKQAEPAKPESTKPATQDTSKPRNSFDELLRRNDAQLQARQHADAMARQMGMAEAEHKASGQKSGLADYTAKIRGKVRGNIVLPPGIQGNPEAVFEVTQLPTGEVINVRLKTSSGNSALDAAIERAINKSSPLPKPADPSLFQRIIEIKYRPVEE